MLYKRYNTLSRAKMAESRLRRRGFGNPHIRKYKDWFEVRVDA